MRRGRVVDFDDHAGLGTVEEAAPTSGGPGLGGMGRSARHPFHCTQIFGGARSIEVGAQVSFVLRAGRSGRWEAVEVRCV